VRTQLRSRLIYASASTLVGGLTFALLGSIDRFPFGPIGSAYSSLVHLRSQCSYSERSNGHELVAIAINQRRRLRCEMPNTLLERSRERQSATHTGQRAARSAQQLGVTSARNSQSILEASGVDSASCPGDPP
jgi:hypothetical protein